MKEHLTGETLRCYGLRIRSGDSYNVIRTYTIRDNLSLSEHIEFFGKKFVPIWSFANELPDYWIACEEIVSISYMEWPVYTEEYCQWNKGKCQSDWIYDKVKSHG